jgi:predicted ATPase
MIERLYVSNFRCLENFSIDLVARPSALVIGKNGSGKSTLRHALGVFQNICRGWNRVRNLITGSDFTQQRGHVPMRFEVDLTLAGKRLKYAIAFEMPEDSGEARVAEESLFVDGNAIFSRQQTQVNLQGRATLGFDGHFAILPIINNLSENSVQQMKAYLASMILIAPIPTNMSGFSEEESVEIQQDSSNFAASLNALLIRYPAAYNTLLTYLKFTMPDLASFENVSRGEKGKQLRVRFEQERSGRDLSLDFNQLSDGEKCFFLSALIVARNKISGPVFCMWDEPDNHLSLPEVGHFVTQLRKMANEHGQFIATSHHPETIRRFSDETTLVLTRKSHLEPTVVRTLADFQFSGDLIAALVRDEVIG